MTRAYLGPLTTKQEIQQLVDDLWASPPKEVALDIETPSLTDVTPLGIGVGLHGGHAFYFDTNDRTLPWHLIWPSNTRKIWFNAPFDLSWEALGQYGADINNIDDGVIVTRMLPTIGNSLVEASQWTKYPTQSMGAVLKEHGAKKVTDLPWEVVAAKCMRDVQGTMAIWEKFRPKIDNDYYEVERRFLSLLMKMSQNGILLDSNRVKAIDAELEENEKLFAGKCNELGFNPYSPKTVAMALNQAGYILPTNWKTDNPVTDNDALKGLPSTLAQLTLLARKYRKLHTTYVHKWLVQKRTYAHYKMDAATGRTSSDNDNHQNIPTGNREGDIIPLAGKVASCLIPDAPEGGTIFDLKGIELRVIAYLSQDKNMMAVLNDPSRDIHRENQLELDIYSRVQAKNVGFGFFFGGTAPTLMQFTGLSDVRLMEEFILKLRKLYPRVYEWSQEQRKIALTKYEVTTLYGRKLPIAIDIGTSQHHIGNCGINYPVQGSAAENWKRVFIAIVDKEGVSTDDLRAQIHDGAWLNDIYWPSKKVPEYLENLAPFWTPIDVKHVRRYG